MYGFSHNKKCNEINYYIIHDEGVMSKCIIEDTSKTCLVSWSRNDGNFTPTVKKTYMLISWFFGNPLILCSILHNLLTSTSENDKLQLVVGKIRISMAASGSAHPNGLIIGKHILSLSIHKPSNCNYFPETQLLRQDRFPIP